MIAQTISHYKILEKLGEGGMGVVYKAEDIKLKRTVALKFITPHAVGSEAEKTRFVHEAQAAAALDHPNICTVYEIDEAEGKTFIVMAYIEGQSLKEKIQSGPLKLDEALDLAIQVAQGLQEAHGKGTVHRDIKSANIVVTEKGQAKIMDFGLAEIAGRSRVTKEGMTVGTAAYMSPEQARGEKLDQRTDIWSLGVVVYEMITGRPPFSGEYEQAIVYQILNEEPEPITSLRSNVPMELERIVKKAMQKDRASRYQHVDEMLTDLRSLRKEIEAGLSKEPLSKVAPSRRRRVYLYGGVAGLVILAVVALYFFLPSKPTVVEKKSIAVLPFKNFSESKEDEYFSDGMTESIITDLAKVPGLLVIARNSVFQYKGKNADVLQVGKELNVRYVLEGSMQRAGNTLRVNAQLIDASNGFHLWANRFDRDMRDVFAVQDDISKNIVSALKLTLTPVEEQQLMARATKNLEAYDYYLRGKFHFNERNKSDNDSAIALFERAIATDPTFSSAYAALARAYTLNYFQFEPQQKHWEEKAFIAIEKALSLDPNLSQAYLARGELYWTPSNHFPHEKAIKEYRRALALNPNLDEAFHQLAVVYVHIGLFDKVVQEANKALEINPTNIGAQFRIGTAHLYQGNYEQALAILEKLPKRWNPSIVGIQTATALLYLRKKGEALSLLEQLSRDLPDDPWLLSTQALILASVGEEHEAAEKMRTAAEKEKTYFGHFHHAAYNIASTYALMKKNQLAIEWLQKAAEDGYPCYPKFEMDPNLNNLRSDPQFISFMEKLKKQWEYYKANL